MLKVWCIVWKSSATDRLRVWSLQHAVAGNQSTCAGRCRSVIPVLLVESCVWTRGPGLWTLDIGFWTRTITTARCRFVPDQPSYYPQSALVLPREPGYRRCSDAKLVAANNCMRYRLPSSGDSNMACLRRAYMLLEHLVGESLFLCAATPAYSFVDKHQSRSAADHPIVLHASRKGPSAYTTIRPYAWCLCQC